MNSLKLIVSFIKEWLIPIAIALVIALLINKFLIFKIVVPTESMVPTIMPGDRIMSLRVHNPANLKRGNIVVFNSKELKMTLVKRLIGLPGDTVELKEGGVLYINGNKVAEPYVVNKDTKTGSFKVPAGHYLFFGDNRPVSEDARYWQQPYISGDDILGRAVFTIYPFNRAGKLK